MGPSRLALDRRPSSCIPSSCHEKNGGLAAPPLHSTTPPMRAFKLVSVHEGAQIDSAKTSDFPRIKKKGGAINGSLCHVLT
jgi:hypothetical protein